MAENNNIDFAYECTFWVGLGRQAQFCSISVGWGSSKAGAWNDLQVCSLTCLALGWGSEQLEARATGAPQASLSLCALSTWSFQRGKLLPWWFRAPEKHTCMSREGEREPETGINRVAFYDSDLEVTWHHFCYSFEVSR